AGPPGVLGERPSLTSLWFVRQNGYRAVTTTATSGFVVSSAANSPIRIGPISVPTPAALGAAAAAATVARPTPDAVVVAVLLLASALLGFSAYRKRRRMAALSTSASARRPPRN